MATAIAFCHNGAAIGMPKTIRKNARKIAEKRHEFLKGSDFVSAGGITTPPINKARTRKYARVVPEGMERLMEISYANLPDGKFKRPGSIRSMQRKNRDPSKCYKAAWLSGQREFDADRCLLFPAFVPGRRVRVKFNYRMMAAAEAMALMALGSPPSADHVAAHKCGNGHLSCVNPKHLYWATTTENARDRVLHDLKTPPADDLPEDVIEAIKADNRLAAVIAWELGIPVATVFKHRPITTE